MTSLVCLNVLDTMIASTFPITSTFLRSLSKNKLLDSMFADGIKNIPLFKIRLYLQKKDQNKSSIYEKEHFT